MAGNPGSDPQKQFLTLIRNFATEKSQGERRIVDLKKQTEEIRSEVETANLVLGEAKRAKEMTEQELIGYEAELRLSETSIKTLESRTSVMQDEFYDVGSVLDALKDEEEALRDEFINQMVEFNAMIRKSLETFSCGFKEESSLGTVTGGQRLEGEELDEVDLKTLEGMIAHVISQINLTEEEHCSEQNIQKQIQQEFIDSEKKASLIEVIMKATNGLASIRWQTSELQELCDSAYHRLERRCICPKCYLNNLEVMDELLKPK